MTMAGMARILVIPGLLTTHGFLGEEPWELDVEKEKPG